MNLNINKIFSINQYKLLFLVCFTLPMYTRANNIILGIFILFCLGSAYKNRNTYNYSSFKQFLPIILFFLLALIASLNNIESNFFKYIERYLSFLLIPIAFWIKGGDRIKLIHYAFWGLIIGCVATLAICYINTFYEIYTYNEPISYFLRWRHLSHRFTNVANTHPAYLGLFVCTSSFYLLFEKIKINNTIKIFILIFFFFGLLQLASRVALFIYFSTILIFILSLIKKNFRYGLTGIILILITLSVYFSKGSNYYKERFFSYNSIAEDSRFDRLKASFDIFIDNPIFGVGFQHIDNIRINKYEEYGDLIAAKKGYNAHNQMLEYLSVNGVIGGVIYIGVFGFLLGKSLKTKNYLFLFIIISFFAANLTESMMVRIKGIEYFSIFISLFLFNNKQHTTSKL